MDILKELFDGLNATEPGSEESRLWSQRIVHALSSAADDDPVALALREFEKFPKGSEESFRAFNIVLQILDAEYNQMQGNEN